MDISRTPIGFPLLSTALTQPGRHGEHCRRARRRARRPYGAKHAIRNMLADVDVCWHYCVFAGVFLVGPTQHEAPFKRNLIKIQELLLQMALGVSAIVNVRFLE